MFDFFEERGNTLYGERFGRAIEYELKKETLEGTLQVSFKERMIEAENVNPGKEPTKEELIAECIAALLKKHGTIYVDFKVYAKTIKFTYKGVFDSLVIEDCLKELKEDYMRNIDIY